MLKLSPSALRITGNWVFENQKARMTSDVLQHCIVENVQKLTKDPWSKMLPHLGQCSNSIIRSFKRHYCKKLMKHVLRAAESPLSKNMKEREEMTSTEGMTQSTDATIARLRNARIPKGIMDDIASASEIDLLYLVHSSQMEIILPSKFPVQKRQILA
ncbi:hypothetical protein DM01DRAFT_330877 [Hesseltinella vesiculosa]|uniref:Uncharacterized protein n=1 Tax=Hesseltinella vesiculosa TaxID=101127 RepID=A0A1X2GNC0_9FUNG|nr:hypothetical protein DM01DRAFT_330877 [Hesseltinella vesiculosa]